MFKKLILLLLLQCSFSVIAQEQANIVSSDNASKEMQSHVAQHQLEEFLSKVQSLSARFKQQLNDQYGYALQESAGTLRMQRPGKFYWDYVLPYPQSIISNGKKIWMYDSELEQVNVRPYDQVLASSPINLLDKNQKLDIEFNIQELPFADNQYWVKLLPKNTESDFKKMMVGLQDGKIKTMKFVDNFNQVTLIEFDKLVINPEFNPGQFEFIAPQGTDVLGDF